MDNPQHYQPLSAAITPSPYIPHHGRSPQQLQYQSYTPHTGHHPTASTSSNQRQEEEEEEEEDVEGELDPNQHDSAHSSPRPAQSASTANQYSSQTQDQAHTQQPHDDGSEKRKPGRPRGSRNRKPRAPANSPANPSKAPTNTQHPGFYSYPPAPGGQAAQNQQFYEFQWRALNLCSEFYNAAEELIKNAPPMVIAQCYQMGPVQKIDPLGLIAEAKRVCDNLLANPAQLVGTVPPPMYPQYGQMPPPPPPATSAPAGSASVITNPQTFVMSLSTPGMPAAHPAPYYPPVYAAPGQRYPTTVTTPYYSYPQGTAAYYPPQPQPPQSQTQPPPQQAPVPVQAPVSAPTASASVSAPPPATTATAAAAAAATTAAPPSGTLSTFNAATGNVAPGGQQGTWSEDETERLRRLAEQSREANKGDIEWDWVIAQWGNSRTRHQILLKATSMGLKESTTRGTKRRREVDHAGSDSQAATAASTGAQAVSSASGTPSISAAVPPGPSQSPAMQNHTTHTTHTAHTTPTQTHTSINSTPTSVPPSRTQPTQPQTHTQSHTPTTATASSHPWPPPTIAANIPSPVMVHSQPDPLRMTTGNNTMFRRPSGAAQQTAYGTMSASPTTQHSRPPSSQAQTQAGQSAQHQFMYRPNDGRRENGYS